MSKSNLATLNIPAYEGNYTVGRSGRKIEAITIHHMAGKLTATQCGQIFQQVNRCSSAHYGIGYGGEIANYVDENNTAWTNSNWDSNCKSVTIETSNNIIGGDWNVSDESLNSLIKLVADIGKRNNLGTLVKGKNVTWHSMYYATTCPGNYLLSKMDYIIAEANKINNSEIKPVEPVSHKYKIGDHVIFSTCYTSSTAPINEAIPVSKMSKNHGVITKIVNARNPYLLDNDLCWVNDGDIRGFYTTTKTKSVDEVAREVIQGKWGNGQERVNRLTQAGYDPNVVQKRVNELM